MDISTVPLIDAIILTGLDFSMKPARVRYEVDKGFITPFPEIKVMHQIKSLAVMVYNQEKMTSLYHGNICDARNPLAYFICAVHRQQAPQPQTHTRQGSTSSVNSNSSNISCTSTGRKKHCELPKLVTTSMLPLGYWDGLYYALVAEIRSLHQDLQQRFGFGCESGTVPLHYNGPDGTTSQPINAIELASMLEAAWYILMDSRLVATLDDAVRMRKMRENAAKQLSNPDLVDECDVPERPPIVYGLMDVNDLAPEIISALLWDKHKIEVDRACDENFEDESMMTAYRAELHQKQIEEGITAASPLQSAIPCACHLTCVCKMKCDQAAEGCTCQNRVHVYHVVHDEGDDSTGAHDRFVKQDETVPNHFVGAAATNLAQMQIASLAYPDVKGLAKRLELKDTITSEGDRRPNFSRKRTDTANSDLAYVPSTKGPHRGVKDTTPLELYGHDSMQRYTTMRPSTPFMSPNEGPFLYGNPPGASMKSVPRKPVPAPILPQPSSQADYEMYYQDHEQAHTPLESSPTTYQTFSQGSQIAYPTVPESQSQSMFTQSLPISEGRKMYTTERGHRSGIRVANQQTNSYPADDYINLLPSHPSIADEPYEAFPNFTRPTTRSRSPSQKPTKTSPSTLANLPGFKSFRKYSNNTNQEKPLASQPLPDFLAPRPASKQRYVSAGGDAKLADRYEIPGPFPNTQPPPIPKYSGSGLKPEAIDGLMNDTEWVRKRFGDAAVPVAAASTPVRGSEDSFTGVIRSSGGRDDTNRGSEDIFGGADKRDRTSSSASKRSKFMKVFARKNSSGTRDGE